MLLKCVGPSQEALGDLSRVFVHMTVTGPEELDQNGPR